jgi:murein DD-endopeptidase MepM/ murein hydrolase activator NlpD
MFEGSRFPPLLTIGAALATLLLPAPAAARGDANIAALQVGLRAEKVYAGPIDGVAGAATTAAVIAFQRQAGLAADGVAGPQTRAALGRYGKSELGARLLAQGAFGWDVAALQFSLAWHGFPSGTIDGRLGERTEAAVRRFQRWSGLGPDGIAGPGVFGLLVGASPTSPLRLSPPLAAAPDDLFGPRGDRFHTGIDYPVPAGTPVGAARSGHVAYAGWHPGGWGYLVTVAHGSGVRTMYAHLSRVDVRVGMPVEVGTRVGLVGSSGISTGPHLHFEVRLRGAAVDPLPALQG